MATLGNCKKTAEKKQTEGKNLNSSANPSPLKASDGTLIERIIIIKIKIRHKKK